LKCWHALSDLTKTSKATAMCLRGVMVPHFSRAATMKALRPLIMSWYGVLFTLVMEVSIIQCFVFDMDLKLDSALQKGGAIQGHTFMTP
jgi:hypothetical protein